jgi:hypothetical protein
MRKLVILAAMAAIAAVAALAAPTQAGAQSSPFASTRTALSTCVGAMQANPVAFRQRYGVGFWRFSPLAHCFLLGLSSASPPAPPSPPPPSPPSPPSPPPSSPPPPTE